MKKNIVFLIFIAISFCTNCPPLYSIENLSHVHGYSVYMKYDTVINIFNECILNGTEFGGNMARVVNDCTEINVWGGTRNDFGDPWLENTICPVFSNGKGVTATTLTALYDNNFFDFNDKIKDIWSEFGKNGKDNMTIEILTSHGAGLMTMPIGITLNQLNNITEYDLIIENLTPSYPILENCQSVEEEEEDDHSENCPHAYNFLYLGNQIDAIVRRMNKSMGRDLDQLMQEYIANPLGMDFFWRLPLSEYNRTADMSPPTNFPRFDPKFFQFASSIGTPGTIQFDIGNPGSGRNPIELFNIGLGVNNILRTTYMPSAIAYTNALSLAKMWGMIANHGKMNNKTIISNSAIKRANFLVYNGTDKVFTFQNTTFTSVGWRRPSPRAFFSNDLKNVGHGGAGGTQGYANFKKKSGFSYVGRRNYGERDDTFFSPHVEQLLNLIHLIEENE